MPRWCPNTFSFLNCCHACFKVCNQQSNCAAYFSFAIIITWKIKEKNIYNKWVHSILPVNLVAVRIVSPDLHTTATQYEILKKRSTWIESFFLLVYNTWKKQTNCAHSLMPMQLFSLDCCCCCFRVRFILLTHDQPSSFIEMDKLIQPTWTMCGGKKCSHKINSLQNPEA